MPQVAYDDIMLLSDLCTLTLGFKYLIDLGVLNLRKGVMLQFPFFHTPTLWDGLSGSYLI